MTTVTGYDLQFTLGTGIAFGILETEIKYSECTKMF